MAQIVETIVADTLAELRGLRDRDTPADMVELRLDGVRDVDVAGALSGRNRAVIVTCRPKWEGGRFDGSEEERVAMLTRAAELGADFVDVEWKAGRAVLDSCRRRTNVIVSHHDFTAVPTDLKDRVRAMRALEVRVVKVAVTAETLKDCVTLKDAMSGGAGSHVALAMGAAGRLTRLWPAWIGSRWTYGGSAAPGQVSTQELATRYRVRETTASTMAYGVAGAPLGHSASPAMHNAAFAALDMDAVYLPLETRSAIDLFTAAEALGLSGASITIPLKRELLGGSVELDDLSKRIGALNTLRRGARGWEGRNFDVAGFLAPLEERALTLSGMRALVVGAGGAARAAVHALHDAGCDLTIAARRDEAARALAREFGVRAAVWPPVTDWELLINTTPVGMWPQVDDTPLQSRAFAGVKGRIVYDMVYNPLETRLLSLAREAGARTIGGLEMLGAQAALQFEWWTGRPAPRDVMLQAARDWIGDAAGPQASFENRAAT